VKNLTYLRYEFLRTLRNRRFLVFSLIFPLVLFFFVAGANKNIEVDGITFPLYYMTGMAAWGSMTAMLSSGARIAAERQIGWTRQMRITPLSTPNYFAAKIVCGYFMAILSIVVLALAGTSLGVRLSAVHWLIMLLLMVVGLIPFAVIGILLGHLMKVDSLGPMLGGITSLFALLGGAFGPLGQSGFLLKVIKGIPSYWLVQASHTVLGASSWPPAESWIVIAAWTLVMYRIASRVYRRDTQRV
jgi:ABC-2 type transport system permease protein